ncbi:hypothetical protein [Marichromatium gracile]|uniref:Uncharacterized protein n=1 Tax=Marichromatium gracile TaxID=1048 RepID=A0ABR5VE17_MARGR|nr:hypothetical protein [Marichromatium gracile]KXX63909.1 hypothetical protein AY586_15580 [Marichromatium gracile]
MTTPTEPADDTPQTPHPTPGDYGIRGSATPESLILEQLSQGPKAQACRRSKAALHQLIRDAEQAHKARSRVGTETCPQCGQPHLAHYRLAERFHLLECAHCGHHGRGTSATAARADAESGVGSGRDWRGATD